MLELQLARGSQKERTTPACEDGDSRAGGVSPADGAGHPADLVDSGFVCVPLPAQLADGFARRQERCLALLEVSGHWGGEQPLKRAFLL